MIHIYLYRIDHEFLICESDQDGLYAFPDRENPFSLAYRIRSDDTKGSSKRKKEW